MNFLEKLEKSKNDMLSFLTELGFEEENNGYRNGYYSCNKLYYNRVKVFIEGDYVKAVNHQDYDIGGETGVFRAEMEVEDMTDDKVLELINEVLPNDLD